MVRQAFSIVLVTALVCMSAGARAAGSQPAAAARSQAAAGNSQFLIFDLAPAGSYSILKNGSSAGTQVASPATSVTLADVTQTGDRYVFTLTGIEPVTPTTPTGVVAVGSTDGCVVVRWNTAAATEYVVDYSLLWGTNPGVYTDSVQIDRLGIVKNGAQSTHTRCGMPGGTFHFALRAHNSFDLWSGRSAPSTTTISNQNTAGPVPPTNLRVTEPSFGCAQATWKRVSDPSVAGYRVYFGRQRRNQAAYTDSIDAGAATTASRCALAAGTYYFAVRAFTGTGVFSGYSAEVALVAQGTDVAAPALSQRTPSVGATGVPLNANIFFVLTDDKTGVSTSSVQVLVNGVVVTPSLTPASNGYAVQCNPAADFPANADVLVELTASDRASPANVLSRNWTFRTGSAAANDVGAPTLQVVSPGAGAIGVESRPTIAVSLADAGLGVDFTSVEMRVNGTLVAFTVDGTPSSAEIRYRPDAAFGSGTEVRVDVEACDRAAVQNCATTLVFTFTVGTDLASVTGAIVPDGFWAHDPNRPLEVRNLPRTWMVRIFDATGVAVRRFQSNADGYTWSWDFTNDTGQRVAPALYLVRVTDGSGAVHSAGRFLVQSEQ
jgi:Bacterial Ig-like domain